MRRRLEALIFFVLVALLLGLRFCGGAPDGWLYGAVVEDPASAFSLLPWDVLTARELHGGHFPLWNDLSGTGMPLWANLQSSPANPMKWPFYIFFQPVLLDLMLIVRLALAGTFAFVLARELGRSRAASALAGTAFAFSGYFMKHFNMVNVASEMWLPLLLYFILRDRREGPRAGRMLAAAIVWALVLLGGNPEAAFYTTLLALAFALWIAGREKFAAMALASFALPFCLGAIIGSVQILPFLEYLPQGFHIHDDNLSRMVTFPAKLVSSLAAPWLTGPHATIQDQKLAAPHVGMIVFALALGAVIHPKRLSRPAWFFAAAAAVLLALVYSSPPLCRLSRLPPFSISGNQKFAMAGVSLGCAVLAGFGLDLLAAAGFRSRGLSPAIAISAALLLGGAFSARYYYNHFDRPGFIVPFIAISALAAAAVTRGKNSSAPGTRIAAALALIAMAELFILAHGYRFTIPFTRDSVALNPADNKFQYLRGLTKLRDDPDHPRFTGLDGDLHHNINILAGVPDLRAFEGMYPRRYVKAMGEIEGFDMDHAVDNFMSHGWSFDVRRKNLDSPLLKKMGVAAVSITPGDDPPEGFEKGPDGLYRDKGAYPRAWAQPGQAARIEKYLWDLVEVKAVGPGELILADTYFPGWKAMVGARETRIEPHLDLFREVKIGAGETRVTFIYRPAAFRIGLWAALAGLFSAAGFFFWAADKHE